MSPLPSTIARALLALSATTCLVSAQASTLTFSFTAHGIGAGPPMPVACGDPVGCLDLAVAGVADDWLGFGSPIPGSWDYTASFTQSLSTGEISGDFMFAGVGGAPDFWGTFTGGFVPVPGVTPPPVMVMTPIAYTVTGGTGLFVGATGIGASTVYVNLTEPSYVESGVFQITPVPEPATWGLFGAGLLAAGAWARRQRRSL